MKKTKCNKIKCKNKNSWKRKCKQIKKIINKKIVNVDLMRIDLQIINSSLLSNIRRNSKEIEKGKN